MSEPDQYTVFIQHLAKQDAKAYAELRRSLAFDLGTDYKVFRYIEPHLERYKLNKASHRGAHYLVAGLYALANRPQEKQVQAEQSSSEQSSSEQAAISATEEKYANFGTAIGRYHAAEYSDSDNLSSIERRFLQLLDADEDQRVYFLRQLIMLTKDKEQVSIPWPTLLKDLCFWSDETRQRWAKQFYLHYKDSAAGKK